MRGESFPPGRSVNALASEFANARFVSRGIQTVKPSLDSVVLMTGQVIGPDTFDVIGESRARSAAVDEVFGKLSDTALSDADLAAWINSQLAQPAQWYRGGGLLDHGVEQRLAVLNLARDGLRLTDRTRVGAALKSTVTLLFR